MTTAAKCFEAADAVKNGADEIDMVVNIGKLLSEQYSYVRDEIRAIKNACDGRVLKVIVETGYLTEEQISMVTVLVEQGGADFIKTSTGMALRGATLEDIKIFRQRSSSLRMKAAGGVRDTETAHKYIALGVERIGTSNSVDIVQGKEVKGGY